MILEVFMPLLGAFLISFLAVPIVIDIAKKKRLFDLPNDRKVHKRSISALGGVAIFAGFLVSGMLFIPAGLNPEFRFLFVGTTIIFLLGLKDDLDDLSAINKLIGQILVASILIHAGGLRLESMYGFLGLTEVPTLFSYGLTYFTIIVVMNSFNLIDGIDGLATSLGILSLSIFGIYFFLADQIGYSMLAFSLMGSLMAFLIFNHQPARIFMGDSGALVIGTVNSILVIRFIHLTHSSTAAMPLNGSVALGFAILFVPLLDTLRMFTVRLLQRKSPFSPDRNHFHHILLDWGLSHTSIVLTAVLLNTLFIFLAWQFRDYGSTLVLLSEVVIAFIGFGFLYYRRPKVNREVDAAADVPVINIIPDRNSKAE